MSEAPPPFVDNGNGLPTPESIHEALSLFDLQPLADMQINFRGQPGSMVDLIARCRIDRLTQNWPKDFIAQVIGAATQASQPDGTR